ncbi:hypothetical protein [Methanobacterium sp.]|uniref:hypothetical protein n=1 Tax=Methanobacterium sp. TaxID=2164 RepID=UPI003C70EC64
MNYKLNFGSHFRNLMDKNVLKVVLPGKWTFILFIVIFILFFAWGTTFNKNSDPVVASYNIEQPGAVSYLIPFPWHPTQQNLAVLLVGEVAPIIGQFNLFWNIVDDSLWLGTYYTTLNYGFKDYLSIFADYYCILISLEAGILFSFSLFGKKVRKKKLWDAGSLVLYRSIIILIIVLIFHYGY